MTPEAMKAIVITSILQASLNSLVTLGAFISNTISNAHIILGLTRFALAMLIVGIHQPGMINNSENVWRLVMIDSTASTGIFGISVALVILNINMDENIGIYINMFVLLQQIANVAIMNIVVSKVT